MRAFPSATVGKRMGLAVTLMPHEDGERPYSIKRWRKYLSGWLTAEALGSAFVVSIHGVES